MRLPSGVGGAECGWRVQFLSGCGGRFDGVAWDEALGNGADE